MRRQIASWRFICYVHGGKRVIFSAKKSRRIYKHITTEHESKHAACSMNFNFDDMGISLDTCSCNILRGYEQRMARATRESSVPIGFLYLKALDLVKIISFHTYFHVSSPAGGKPWRSCFRHCATI